MSRRPLAVASVGVALVLALAPAADAAGIQIDSAGGRPFPDRSFVLTLPATAPLTAGQVRVTENGQAVRRVNVVPGDQAGPRAFGVVLAIDTSESMHGSAIMDAMSAAREFASRRPANTQLGVVFFNRTASVALPLTSDVARISAVLARPPLLSRGTRIYDATSTSLQVLEDAGISAGSVVLLSDGADAGSTVSETQITNAARRARARLFTVGLRSASYDPAVLSGLAQHADGAYAEAASSAQLRRTYGALADRFGRQYLLSYQSLAPLGSAVAVRVTVDGQPGSGTAAYRAPVLQAGPARHAPVSGPWGSPVLEVGIVTAFALLVASTIFLVVRPRRRDVRERVAGFVAAPSTLAEFEDERHTTPLARKAEERLGNTSWWATFAENCDVGQVSVRPLQLVALTALGALLVIACGLALPNPGIVLLGVLLPGGPFALVQLRAGRQRRAFEDQLPDNLQVIASAMRAGHSFVGALAIAKEDAAEPSARELSAAVRDEQLGMPLDQAIAAVAKRMRSEEFQYVGLVATLQRESGGNTAEVLDRVTETVRGRADLRRTVQTLTAQGRLSGIVVSALPVVLGVAILVLNPSYMDPLLHRTSGQMLLALAVGLVIGGWFVIRRIVDIKV
jgi:tight adherence protein B